MNKIYNNLTIENLIKTEWFNQFDEEQQEQIILGLKNKVDVLKFAKKEFDSNQMGQIRLGLAHNLDVSVYAKEYFNFYQMAILKDGLENNVDVSIYAKPEIDWKEMLSINEKLKNNLDVSENKITKDSFLNKQKKRIVSFFNSLKNK